ncbi:MAG: hypothetical protein RSC92_05625, partial [Clostridia bacterium]
SQLTNKTFKNDISIQNDDITLSIFNTKYNIITDILNNKIVNLNKNTFSINNKIEYNKYDKVFIQTNDIFKINKFYKENGKYNSFIIDYNDKLLKGDVIKISVDLYEETHSINTSKLYSFYATARILDIIKVDSKLKYIVRCDFPAWVLDNNGNVLDIHNKITVNSDAFKGISLPDNININSTNLYYYDVNISKAWETPVQMYLDIKEIKEYENKIFIYPYKHNMVNYLDRNFYLEFIDFNLDYVYNIWNKLTVDNFSKLEDNIVIDHAIELLINSKCVYKKIWQIFKDDDLLLTVYNNSLNILLKDKGKYSINLTMYDELGNLYYVNSPKCITIK